MPKPQTTDQQVATTISPGTKKLVTAMGLIASLTRQGFDLTSPLPRAAQRYIVEDIRRVEVERMTTLLKEFGQFSDGEIEMLMYRYGAMVEVHFVSLSKRHTTEEAMAMNRRVYINVLGSNARYQSIAA